MENIVHIDAQVKTLKHYDNLHSDGWLLGAHQLKHPNTQRLHAQ